MPHYGLCPYWIDEGGKDMLITRCAIGEIRFFDKKRRRLIAFGYCSGNWKECSIYKALAEAAEISDCERIDEASLVCVKRRKKR